MITLNNNNNNNNNNNSCNIEILNNIQPVTLRKRLTNELLKQITDSTISFTVCDLQKEDTTNDDYPVEIIIEDKLYTRNNKYKFKMNKYYPFKQPVININNKTYFQFIQFSSQKSLQMLKTLFGYDCLCCQTQLCSFNWLPKVTLYNIVEEIRLFRNCREKISFVLLLEKIVKKYLHKDLTGIIYSYL
jgi:ubiquitin-protein ligase